MFDLTAETAIPLARARKFFPPGRGGKSTHISTLVRWIINGARSNDGTVVRLEALRIGSRWVTSREAIQRFAEALTPRLNSASPASRTRTARLRASKRAAEQLDKLGL
jgi:hypothetical protein